MARQVMQMFESQPQGDRVVRRYERYAMAPVQLLRSPDITSHAVRVFLLLDSYANWDTQAAFPAQSRLAEEMGVSVPTVRRATRELVDAGYLAVEARIDGRGRRLGNTYTLFDAPHIHGSQVSGGMITGDTVHGSPVTGRPITGERSINNRGFNNTDNNREGDPSNPALVVVSSATPPKPEPDTAGERPAKGPQRLKDGLPVAAQDGAPQTPDTGCDDQALLKELLEAAADLPPEAARRLLRGHGAASVREHLKWLYVEQEVLLAGHQPPIASPGAWLRRSFEWLRPPASYRKRQEQDERARQRAECAVEAERKKALEEARQAESAERLRAAHGWFLRLPERRQQDIDKEIRDRLSAIPALHAAEIPRLPDVLTQRGLGATLWRDCLLACWVEAVPQPQSVEIEPADNTFDVQNGGRPARAAPTA